MLHGLDDLLWSLPTLHHPCDLVIQCFVYMIIFLSIKEGKSMKMSVLLLGNLTFCVNLSPCLGSSYSFNVSIV